TSGHRTNRLEWAFGDVPRDAAAIGRSGSDGEAVAVRSRVISGSADQHWQRTALIYWMQMRRWLMVARADTLRRRTAKSHAADPAGPMHRICIVERLYLNSLRYSRRQHLGRRRLCLALSYRSKGRRPSHGHERATPPDDAEPHHRSIQIESSSVHPGS